MASLCSWQDREHRHLSWTIWSVSMWHPPDRWLVQPWVSGLSCPTLSLWLVGGGCKSAAWADGMCPALLREISILRMHFKHEVLGVGLQFKLPAMDKGEVCFLLCLSCDLAQAPAELPACWVCDISLDSPVLSVFLMVSSWTPMMKAVFLARRKFVHKRN